MAKQIVCWLLRVRGTVQGVGFRPFVYNWAMEYQLAGRVFNDGVGVVIEVEGDMERVESFYTHLQTSPPVLARIDNIQRESLPLQHYRGFVIEQSQGFSRGNALVPPDIATCIACHKEIADPTDRHFQYPFTNCTNCGPRFTIINDLPYDRHRTVMKPFVMCADCAREYNQPSDRRFHAQPVACPACGPQISLVDRQGNQVAGDWLARAGELLREGNILAIKGLGGFHLACDAANTKAVAELRRRKGRPNKPLAVMCRNLSIAKGFCFVTKPEEELLESPAAPIVLLQKKAVDLLSDKVAFGLNTLGVMLPYTPLHHLLLQQGPPILVMTSGNRSNLPLVIDNRFALEELGNLADYFLYHNRNINNRCDDSVTTVVGGKSRLMRRSRGYVPQPLEVPINHAAPSVLAVGGDMKNTFCLLHEGKAYLSQHLGEVASLEGRENLVTSIDKFCRLIGIKPEVITGDLHPHYSSSSLADELAVKLAAKRHPGVQHHHAHLASCLAENGVEEEVIGIILDGTGYGLDDRLWGFEIMRGDYRQFTREYYLDYLPLPGGERSIRYPWLSATSYLITFLGDRGINAAQILFPDRIKELRLVEKMLASGINMPLSSSCGRFFDAIAALLGICLENTYEGEAAVRLSSLVPWFPSASMEADFSVELQPYGYVFQGAVINPTPVLEQVLRDIEHGVAPAVIAKRFHDTVIAMMVKAARLIREKTGLARVALSGGTWQNRYLFGVANHMLKASGFDVLSHHLIPAGDGGIALGQAMVAGKQNPRCT